MNTPTTALIRQRANEKQDTKTCLKDKGVGCLGRWAVTVGEALRGFSFPYGQRADLFLTSSCGFLQE